MKLAVCTLGCKVNTYESEYLIEQFINKGYELVDFINDSADLYIINTCTVTSTSDSKSRKMIRHARKMNSKAIIVVMGCHTQNKDNALKALEYADIVLGTTKKNEVLNLVEKYKTTHEKILINEDSSKAEFDNMKVSNFHTRTRAFVKIQDGCNNFCSYCIIPYMRGRVRSKKPSDVIDEITNLVNNGYKEVVLTGIHTGHYGSDLDNYDFSDLLMELEKIEGLERIRISSIEITELNDKFMETLKKSKKIVNHIHIPLQAGSNHILKLMNRKYDKAYFMERINTIKSIRPSIAITTDTIVGFPGETEEDFIETLEFVEELDLAGGHAFPYSNREGTAASKMKGQLTKEVKHERVKKLISKFDMLEERYYKKYINKEVVIIPETYEDGYLVGHTENYLKVKVLGCKKLIGSDVLVIINNYENKMLLGTIKE